MAFMTSILRWTCMTWARLEHYFDLFRRQVAKTAFVTLYLLDGHWGHRYALDINVRYFGSAQRVVGLG